MIKNRVYKLKQDTEVSQGMPLKAGQEIEIVMDCVYINGHPLQVELQPLFYGWVVNNPSLFDDVTLKW